MGVSLSRPSVTGWSPVLSEFPSPPENWRLLRQNLICSGRMKSGTRWSSQRGEGVLPFHVRLIESTIPRGYLASGKTFRLCLDRCPSLRVENVKPGRPHGNAQPVAHLHPRGRLDARHHGTLADLHIEQDFRAELLDHL